MSGTRIAVACAIVAAIAAAAAVSVLATGHSTSHAAAAFKPPAQTSCAKRLVRDWSDGRIDGSYPVACYRAALRTLPSDLQVYSSAPDDIRQALSARIVQNAQKISAHQGATSVRKIESARPSAP
jgi:hypothetical protein